ncbi:MAG TPA: F0F1 ATP synthase subunit epsilon [Acidimicrobiaceae bacterium]|nr:F0F1 ATP synthase subunit epsilon [Acidimicrobiaceae bacterium]
MAATMQVQLVSPEKVLFSGEATQVITRTLGGGEIAFLPGHAPFLAALTENHTRVTLADGTVLDVAVHGGFVQVAGNTVSILSDLAELGNQIDRGRAQRAKDAAEESLRREHDAEAVSALARAHARLAASGGIVGTSQGAH